MIATSSVLITVNELGMALKNPGFIEEGEWRIVAMPVRSGTEIPDAVEFRNTRFGPAPYVQIRLAESGPPALREVVLGPRVEHVAERSIKLMLRRYGCNATVRRSKVSYR